MMIGGKAFKNGGVLLLPQLLLLLLPHRSVVVDGVATVTTAEVVEPLDGDDHRQKIIMNNIRMLRSRSRSRLMSWRDEDPIIRDPVTALAAVEGDGSQLETVSDRLKADKEIVLAAVMQNGYALQFASEDLKVDKEVVLAAVSQVGGALKFVPKILQTDKEIVMAAVSESQNSVYNKALYYASDTLKMDKDVVLAAVDNDYRSFFYADDILKDDLEFVLVIVGDHDGRALEFVSPDLKMNKAVVTAAVSNNCDALQYASDGMKADEEVMSVPCGTSSAGSSPMKHYYFGSSVITLISVFFGAIVFGL